MSGVSLLENPSDVSLLGSWGRWRLHDEWAISLLRIYTICLYVDWEYGVTNRAIVLFQVRPDFFPPSLIVFLLCFSINLPLFCPSDVFCFRSPPKSSTDFSPYAQSLFFSALSQPVTISFLSSWLCSLKWGLPSTSTQIGFWKDRDSSSIFPCTASGCENTSFLTLKITLERLNSIGFSAFSPFLSHNILDDRF